MRLVDSARGWPWCCLPQDFSVEGDLSQPWIRNSWNLVPTSRKAKRVSLDMIVRWEERHEDLHALCGFQHWTPTDIQAQSCRQFFGTASIMLVVETVHAAIVAGLLEGSVVMHSECRFLRRRTQIPKHGPYSLPSWQDHRCGGFLPA